MLKRTPLFEAHQKLGARLVEFGGWEMPVHYTSIMEEHRVVRTAAGIFDICHMGEVSITGAGSSSFLNQVLTNDIAKLGVGEGQYSLMCNPAGGVIDDLYVYKLGVQEYLLIINASRIDADVPWLLQEAQRDIGAGVLVTNQSETLGAIAIQGPTVEKFIDQCVDTFDRAPSSLLKNQITRGEFAGQPVYLARTGYTGEDGFELVGAASIMPDLWQRALQVGLVHGLKPAGLGARDTLRTEVCYPLYGHELDEKRTPIEAGLGFFVSLDKGPFNGREILAMQKLQGAPQRCVAFKMIEKSPPPRPHYRVWFDGQPVGDVVSGTLSPSLNLGIGMAYVPTTVAQPGSRIEIEIRGQRFAAEVVKKPIYRKAS